MIFFFILFYGFCLFYIKSLHDFMGFFILFCLPCFVLNICNLRAKSFCQIFVAVAGAHFLSIFTT